VSQKEMANCCQDCKLLPTDLFREREAVLFLITNTKWALHVQGTFLLFPIYLVKKKIIIITIIFKITIIIKAKIKTTIMTRTIMAAIKLKIS